MYDNTTYLLYIIVFITYYYNIFINFFSGKISVNIAGDWYYPLNKDKQEDKDAAEIGLKFQVK